MIITCDQEQQPWKRGEDMERSVHLNKTVSQPPAYLATHQAHAYLHIWNKKMCVQEKCKVKTIGSTIVQCLASL